MPIDQITNLDEELKQLHGWKRYIAWEKKNPLKLESIEMLKKRVIFAYEQSFVCLGYHCDLWYEAGAYLQRLQSQLPETSAADHLQLQKKKIENETS